MSAAAQPSPAFIIDLGIVRANCEILAEVRSRADCRIVHALKAFAVPQVLPLISAHLDGCCASGIWEARLAAEFASDGAILTSGPVYPGDDLTALLELSHHLVFNSAGQWAAARDMVVAHPRYRGGSLQCGLRVNPLCSTGSTALYDPCGPGSRLGSPPASLAGTDLDGLSGLHFHTLCEQGSEDLETTLDAVEHHFGDLLRSAQFRWLNLGGGHWITHPDYDRERLIKLLRRTRERYHLEDIWLEPGEAAVLRAGVLVATVCDLFVNGDTHVAVLDVSATAHMPDVLEMPYRPDLLLDGHPVTEEGPNRYRLGGATCLAGDVVGDYAFPRPLELGDRLEFLDMAQYTLVKTTFFNGVGHPSIVLRHEDGRLETVREFSYTDFRDRLG